MKINPVIRVTPDVKPLLNQPVGFVRINKSSIHHNNSFETAAWWEDSEIQKGVYPLILQENRHAPLNLFLSASLDAVVVDDFFPNLWGGMPLSKEPYQSRNKGSKRTIHKSFQIVEAIEQTGNIPDSEIDLCLNPLLWNSLIDAARASMSFYQDLLDGYQKNYQKDGDGDYNNNLGMICHCSENIAALGRAIIAIKDKQRYLNDSSDYMRQNYVRNTEWAVSL